jgi:hypothetical protein
LCCFGVYEVRVGGGFLSLVLDPVYSHAYSVEFSLEYCTCDAQSLSINVYFPGVFYSNHTWPDVVFRF